MPGADIELNALLDGFGGITVGLATTPSGDSGLVYSASGGVDVALRPAGALLALMR